MADPFEGEGDDSVLMRDVLAEQEELEDTVTAVLGDSDDKNCTYNLGYVKRQAVYACTTCIAPEGEPGAICLACSLECHEGHDLIELYTKRNLRCDCGNGKFNGFKCRLMPDKEPRNEGNEYNHNYKGKYCICKRPYPDPEEEGADDDMLQCSLCEDWFHSKHLGLDTLPQEDTYEEMICAACSAKVDFLRYYSADSQSERCDNPVSRVIKQEISDSTEAPASAKRHHNGDVKLPASTLASCATIPVRDLSTTGDVEPTTNEKPRADIKPSTSSRSDKSLTAMDMGDSSEAAEAEGVGDVNRIEATSVAVGKKAEAPEVASVDVDASAGRNQSAENVVGANLNAVHESATTTVACNGFDPRADAVDAAKADTAPLDDGGVNPIFPAIPDGDVDRIAAKDKEVKSGAAAVVEGKDINPSAAAGPCLDRRAVERKDIDAVAAESENVGPFIIQGEVPVSARAGDCVDAGAGVAGKCVDAGAATVEDADVGVDADTANAKDVKPVIGAVASKDVKPDVSGVTRDGVQQEESAAGMIKTETEAFDGGDVKPTLIAVQNGGINPVGDFKPCNFLRAENGCHAAQPTEANQECLLSRLMAGGRRVQHAPNSATFWPRGWRLRLCKCLSCCAMYTEKGVSYLLSDGDTLASYEARGRLKEEALQQQGVAQFHNLNRVQQVEIIQGVNDLRAGLTDFLQGFAQAGRVVREEDIREFFDDLRRKRQRVGINNFCR